MVTLVEVVARIGDIPKLSRDVFEPFETKELVAEEQAQLPVASKGDTVTLPDDADTVPVYVEEETGALLAPDLSNPQ